MRSNIITFFIIALSVILCPMTALSDRPKAPPEKALPAISGERGEEEYIYVMRSSTGNAEKIKTREYVIGSVAAEVPPTYHTEALKAQAVASYTYAKRLKERNEKSGDASRHETDVSDDPDFHQGYIDEKERKKKWKDNFDFYEKKVETAVDAVLGSYLTYNGEIVLAAYHSISAGGTRDAKSLWGKDYPYLVAVESPGDRLSPDFLSEKEFDEGEFKALARKCGVKLKGECKKWVGKSVKTENGYVISTELGGQKTSAGEIRKAFGLKSLCYEIEYDSGVFKIVCRGGGHGAGMSQYGADYMARQGSSWTDILKRYYPGTEIVSRPRI